VLGNRGVHLISHKRLSWLFDALLEDSRKGSGLSASETSQGSHPFHSLFIKARLTSRVKDKYFIFLRIQTIQYP